jgi:hypothetical protein
MFVYNKTNFGFLDELQRQGQKESSRCRTSLGFSARIDKPPNKENADKISAGITFDLSLYSSLAVSLLRSSTVVT